MSDSAGMESLTDAFKGNSIHPHRSESSTFIPLLLLHNNHVKDENSFIVKQRATRCFHFECSFQRLICRLMRHLNSFHYDERQTLKRDFRLFRGNFSFEPRVRAKSLHEGGWNSGHGKNLSHVWVIKFIRCRWDGKTHKNNIRDVCRQRWRFERCLQPSGMLWNFSDQPVGPGSCVTLIEVENRKEELISLIVNEPCCDVPWIMNESGKFSNENGSEKMSWRLKLKMNAVEEETERV